MKLFSKTSSNKADASNAVILAWRPDFRETETLPDLKTVRTSFFLNISSLAIALAVMLFSVHREWTAASLARNLQDVAARTAEAERPSQKAVADFATFEVERKKFEEIKKLNGSSFRLSDYILKLADVLPANIWLNKFELRSGGQTILLGASIEGQDASSNAAVSDFERLLRADDSLKEHFEEIQLINVARDQSSDRLIFELLFTFKQATAKVVGGRK